MDELSYGNAGHLFRVSPSDLAAFARFNPNPVLEFAADGFLTYYNEATETMAHNLGQSIPEEILPPDTVPIVKECLRTGRSRLRIETRIHERVISWSFFPILPQHVVHCYAGDITERKHAEEVLVKAREELEIRVQERTAELAQANLELLTTIGELKTTEEALRQAEAKYRSIFEHALEGIYQSTPEGRYLDVNPALAQMYGYRNPEELVSSVRNIAADIYLDPSVRLEFQKRIESDGIVRGLEYQVRRKDGTVIWISESARSVKNETGRLLFYEGAIQEITARKEAEAEKERLEIQLRQARKMEAIGTLAGGIAHDFNNILAAIIGFTELTLDDLPSGSQQHRQLSEVLRASNRAKDLVKQILTFSRKDKSERRTVCLHQIAQECLKLLRAALPTTVRIHYENLATESLIDADATQIHQVLMNLGVNAGHAMREMGGQLTVKLSSLANAPRSTLEGPCLLLEVSDTGHGMAADTLERLFTPFFTTKPVGEGTGLGLAVVHGIITRHGGQICVESELGVGTTFTILLPKAQTSQPNRPEASPAETFGSGRILFVDDEEPLVRLAEQRLGRWGYSVTAFTTSTEALARFESQPNDFDVIITDQTLPSLTGLEFGRAVKKIRPEIPIILCSGYSPDPIADKAREIGFEGFFSKPLDFAQLDHAVRKILLPLLSR